MSETLTKEPPHPQENHRSALLRPERPECAARGRLSVAFPRVASCMTMSDGDQRPSLGHGLTNNPLMVTYPGATRRRSICPRRPADHSPHRSLRHRDRGTDHLTRGDRGGSAASVRQPASADNRADRVVCSSGWSQNDILSQVEAEAKLSVSSFIILRPRGALSP